MIYYNIGVSLSLYKTKLFPIQKTHQLLESQNDQCQSLEKSPFPAEQ